MAKILIGAPTCQKPAILHAFLTSIERLRLQAYEVFYYFIDDNNDEKSREILAAFQDCHENVLVERNERSALKSAEDNQVSIYQDHKWSSELIWKVADFKDRIIQRAINDDFDYLFLVDSDILLHAQTVDQLINDGKDIISEIFWTKWEETSIPQPQVWLHGFYEQYEIGIGEIITKEEERICTFAFFDMLIAPGVYEVGGLGACTLISKAAMNKGISFKRVKNLNFWGEDRHFCVRANALGIDLFVDTHFPAYHVFRDNELMGGLIFLDESIK